MKSFLARLWDILIGIVILYIVLQVILYTFGIQIVGRP